MRKFPQYRSGKAGSCRRAFFFVPVLFMLFSMLFVQAAEKAPRSWSSYPAPIAFEHLDRAQGLSQGTVYCTLQDRRGFLWFGTEDGLNRYDGNRFKVFRHDARDPRSLAGDLVACLLEDRQGNLWIGSSGGGLNRFDPNTQTFQNYSVSNEPGDLASNDVSSLAEDLEGNLWIGTQGSGGLYMIRRQDLTSAKPYVLAFPCKPTDPTTVSGNNVEALFMDHWGTLWIGTEEGGLCRLIKTSGSGYAVERFSTDKSRPDVSAPPDITSITEDARGIIWIGSTRGLYSYDPERGIFHRYVHRPGDPKGLAHTLVRRVFRDRGNGIWVGTDGGGLDELVFGEAGEPLYFEHHRHDPKDAHSLSSDAVESLYEDRSGVLWIGTYIAGLNKLILAPGSSRHRERRPLAQYRFNPSNPFSLSGNMVNAIAEDRYGNLWVGTDGSGLNRVRPSVRSEEMLRFEHFRMSHGKPGALQDDVITCLHLDKEKRLWAGTFTGGMVRIDQASADGAPRFTHFRKDPKNPASLQNFIVAIFEDSYGHLWVGTQGGGLYELDAKTGRYQPIQPVGPPPPGYSPDSITLAIIEDAYGTLWFGNTDGLDRYNPKTGEFKIYRSSNGLGSSAPYVNALHVDPTGVLWMGTNGGLTKITVPPWNGPEPSFIHYDDRNGLPNNIVIGILDDARGNLWLSTKDTLCRFDVQTGKASPFIWQEELQSTEFLRRAYFKSAQGDLFFGGNNGLNLFRSEAIVANAQAPQLAVTDFQLFSRSVPIGEKVGGHVVLNRSITETQELILSPRDYVFSFEFAALHFVAPGQNHYAYMMEGLDRGWNDVGNRHFITYTTLPPGQYVFRVKAANCDGVWDEQGLRLRIRVLPPWWKTWWFRVALGVTLAGLAYLIVMVRLSALRRRNRLLEEMVQARTQELAEANEALKNQSLTDPLTGLRNRRFLSVCMPEDIAQVQRVQGNAVRDSHERMKLNIDVLFLMVDLDFFKHVNDHHGHHAGDLVIQQVSGILRNAVRTSDTVARWGGEEFLVVARNTARADAHVLPERIRAAIEAHEFDIGESEPLRCTCSVGFSVFPLLPNEMTAFNWEQVIDIADHCLYGAKRSGRNAWVGIVPDLESVSGQPNKVIPKDVPSLVRAKVLPVISSLKSPIQWAFEDEDR